VALKSLGIGAGDEVIVPANTFIATTEAVTLCGAKPVFVDCDSDTYTIDLAGIERAVTPATKAIVPVHLYGQPADMDPILALAEKHNLCVIEDAAQAHGAEYKGRKVGTFGRCACFSFYPSKNLGAYGDGGAMVTNDDALALRVRMFVNHGTRGKYDHEFEGMNSRLDGLQAAVLDVKLPHLDSWNDRRRIIAKKYDDELKSVVVTPRTASYAKHVYHLYVVQARDRNALAGRLEAAGVATGIHYPVSLPLAKAYASFKHTPADFPVAASLEGKILSLPMHGSMRDEEVAYVIDMVKKFA
jgi:dTDP-4-amino-4,6-dideoxygalactose transaminase